jgi:hypothetical protein
VVDIANNSWPLLTSCIHMVKLLMNLFKSFILSYKFLVLTSEYNDNDYYVALQETILSQTKTFLQTIAPSTSRTLYKDWNPKRWRQWYIFFSHFIQLMLTGCCGLIWLLPMLPIPSIPSKERHCNHTTHSIKFGICKSIKVWMKWMTTAICM